MNSVNLSHVESQEDLEDTIVLFEEYSKSLGIDLSFQDFATEMANMPGKYAPPYGTLILARNNETRAAIGCVGLRPLGSNGACEMKRLYVCPTGRGTGLGKKLALTVVDEAKRLGYKAMRLDTLATMASARALYKSLGFLEIEQYYDTPIENTVFLELSLNDATT